MIETGTKGPREQAKRDQKGGTEGMRDRGANGPRDRGNKEASNAAVSARRTGSQEPKAAFSLFVLSFLYSLLTDSARQARGQKLGARSFFPVPCPLVPVPLFPWSLGPCLDHGTSMRQGGVMIGKLGRDQRSGVKDQKRKDLRGRSRGCLGGGGLDRKR